MAHCMSVVTLPISVQIRAQGSLLVRPQVLPIQGFLRLLGVVLLRQLVMGRVAGILGEIFIKSEVLIVFV